MNEEQQRIAIAEARNLVCPNHGAVPSDRLQSGCCPWCREHIIPDYLSDLNESSELYYSLNSEQQNVFEHHLGRILGFANRNDWQYRDFLQATAAQRAEAFLKTIGKWEE